MKTKFENPNLPVFRLQINDEDNTGIEKISLVSRPAIGIKGVAFADEECSNPPCHPNCVCYIDYKGYWQLGISDSGPCPICIENKRKYNNKLYGSRVNKKRMFSDDVEQIIAAPIMIPDILIKRKDSYGEYYVTFTKEDIKAIARKFFKNKSVYSINLEHTEKMVDAYIVEHWQVEDTVKDKSNLMGFELPEGSYFMMSKIEDRQVYDELIKNGQIGYSIEGFMNEIMVNFVREDEPEMTDEEFIDSLSEIELASIITMVEPGKSETESEFMSRCIPYLLDDGTAKTQDQAVAICISKWQTK